MADAWEAPNRLDVVQRVNAQHPGLIHNAHAFSERVVCELRKDDPKWGRNGKRGNTNDLSDDVAAWQNPAVPWGCSIVDIIGGAGGPNPTPAWIDQTRRTAEGGTIGAWVDVECAGTPQPGPGPDPAPEPEPPPSGPDENEIRFRVLDAKLDAVLVALDDAKQQQARDTDQIGKWMVEQAQGVINAVVGQLLPPIQAITCKFRSPFRVADAED